MKKYDTHAKIVAAKNAGCGVAWMMAKKIDAHPEGYEGWRRDDDARIARNRPAAEAWAKKTARELTS